VDGVVAVCDVNCEGGHTVEAWAGDATLQAFRWLDGFGCIGRRLAGSTALALALSPLEQWDLWLQELLKHDAVAIEACVRNVDVE
jgi:hypothetical protein